MLFMNTLQEFECGFAAFLSLSWLMLFLLLKLPSVVQGLSEGFVLVNITQAFQSLLHNAVSQ